jgi:DNA-binding transcriptional LysR family regulator
MFANNMGLLRESTLAGMGVATLPAYLVDDDIRSGRLLRLLPEYTLPDTAFRIVYSTRKHVTLKVKASRWRLNISDSFRTGSDDASPHGRELRRR